MMIINEKKEVHLDNPSLEELCQAVCDVRSDPSLNDFKIMIDGTDENTDSKRELCLSR
jgi:hypothetical protein